MQGGLEEDGLSLAPTRREDDDHARMQIDAPGERQEIISIVRDEDEPFGLNTLEDGAVTRSRKPDMGDVMCLEAGLVSDADKLHRQALIDEESLAHRERSSLHGLFEGRPALGWVPA